MANQYFENNPSLASEIKPIKYYFKGKEITFFADNGVFSKTSIDFGSNLLLKTIKVNDGEEVLDIGCGYGTIGLTVALCNPGSHITMCDVNDRAIGLTEKAMEYNNIKNAEVIHSNIYEKIDKQFDTILTNPPIRAGKKVVHEIILKGHEHLKDGGSLWCVIQKKQGAPSAKAELEKVYKSVEVVENDKGYWIIKATK